MKGLENITWARLWGLVPSVSFQWPLFLWLLLLVPLLVAVYILLLYRRKKTAFRYSNLALVKEASEGPGWRRHVPPALMLMAFTVLLLAMARPSAEVSLPSRVATVMLVMDVSGSMRATDVNPSRIMAAETAAKAYIKQQPKDVRIGIVAFAATALLVQSPTTDHTALAGAIDFDDTLSTGLHDVQREHILRVLNATRWVIEGNSGAALRLGLKPATLRHRMKKLGITRAQNPQSG